jgi:uncharacterized protein (DUF1919 family)
MRPTDLPIIPSSNKIRIGRLERKIEKLKPHLENLDSKIAHYKAILDLDLNFMRQHRDYTDIKNEWASLETRVKEQEALIKLLQKNG